MSEAPKNKKGAPVFTYLAIMFAVAFLMLLLAYFIQQRNNEVAMDGLKDSISSSHASVDELEAEVNALNEKVSALEQEKAELEEENLALQDQIGTLEDELDGVTHLYEEMCQGWEDETWYSFILSNLYFAETKFQEKDYAAAAAVLEGQNTAFFEKTMELYDAEHYMHYEPNGIYLRPRYDALVSSLIDLGYLVRAEDGELIFPAS